VIRKDDWLIKRLRINNLAVVEDVTLEFEEGLNVITGSTGAGKSLILSAVNLLLGRRAPASVIRTGQDAALVECLFEAPGTEEETTTIRREIRRNGRGRIFVNGESLTM